MSSMYDPLRDYLKSVSCDSVRLTYEEINKLIQTRQPKDELPPTAYKRPEWWDNNSTSHTQMYSWTSAGWMVNMSGSKLGEYITFHRSLRE
jgi:hypothetical protein